MQKKSFFNPLFLPQLLTASLRFLVILFKALVSSGFTLTFECFSNMNFLNKVIVGECLSATD